MTVHNAPHYTSAHIQNRHTAIPPHIYPHLRRRCQSDYSTAFPLSKQQPIPSLLLSDPSTRSKRADLNFPFSQPLYHISISLFRFPLSTSTTITPRNAHFASRLRTQIRSIVFSLVFPQKAGLTSSRRRNSRHVDKVQLAREPLSRSDTAYRPSHPLAEINPPLAVSVLLPVTGVL